MRAAFRSMGAAVAETARLGVDPPPRWRERVVFEGAHHLDAALAGGRGAVLASAHIGAWEILPSLIALLGHPVSVMVRSVREARLNAIVAELRGAHGVRLIDLGEHPRAVGAFLRANGVVMIAADQRPRRVRRIPGEFLGRPAWMSSGPATLSRVFGAPLLTAYVRWSDGGGHVVVVEPPVVSAAGRVADRHERDAVITRELGRRYERWIRADPEQWVWFHERWKDAPPGSVGRDGSGGNPDRVGVHRS